MNAGDTIGEHMIGLPPKILSVGGCGSPWWLWLLLALLLLCCCFLCLLLLCCKRKRDEAYQPLTEPNAMPTPAPTRHRKTTRRDPKVTLGWDDGTGSIKITEVYFRPLGIIDDEAWEKRSKVAPLVCKGFTFNSYAKHLGIQENWRLARIQDVDTLGHRNFKEVEDLLNKELAPLKPWPLRLEFKTGGEIKTFMATYKPLGMEVNNVAPIHVKVCFDNSYARHLGIKDKQNDREDWLLAKVGEVDVEECHNFEKVMGMLKEGTDPLDTWGSEEHVEDNIKGDPTK